MGSKIRNFIGGRQGQHSDRFNQNIYTQNSWLRILGIHIMGTLRIYRSDMTLAISSKRLSILRAKAAFYTCRPKPTWAKFLVTRTRKVTEW